MANYITNQKQVQIGEGGAWGVDVDPSVELSGIDSVTLAPSIISELVRAHRGGIVPGRDTITTRHEVQGCSIGGFVIYEQIPYFLNMLDAAAEATTRTYNGPALAQAVPDLQTLVVGHAGAIYNIASPRAGGMTFTWNWGEALKFNMDLMGHSVEDDAFIALDETATASLTYALASQCTVSIDALAGGLGGTAMTNVMGGTLSINTNRKYLRRVGSLFPAGTYDSPYWDITGTIIMEADATSIAFVDALIAAPSTKLIRIKFTNSGAGVLERSLTLDTASIVSAPALFSESDELETVQLQFAPIEEGDFTLAPGGDLDGYFRATSVTNTADLY